jgi:hypothetical protein
MVWFLSSGRGDSAGPLLIGMMSIPRTIGWQIAKEMAEPTGDEQTAML